MSKQPSHYLPLVLWAMAWSAAAATDTPADYAYALPLTVAKTGVVQLRLPLDADLHARTSSLDDVRVFDAGGAALPYALRMPATERSASHRQLAMKIFPLMDERRADQLDLDVHTDGDGRLTSVRVRPDQPRSGGLGDGDVPGGAKAPRLAALILDLGPAGASGAALIDALRFTAPPKLRGYSAQVWLDTSDDMKQWDAAGGTELNWLLSADAQMLANDKLEFPPRRFRYGRLSWRSGTPRQFAAVSAQQLLTSLVAPDTETLLLPAAPGRQAGDLVYTTPLAVAAPTVGLQFTENNVVLPAQLGTYRELPPRQLGQTGSWRFEPLLSATFYRIAQGDRLRASGDVDVAPVHTTQWVLRPQGPAVTRSRPALRLSWTPASIVFLASGNAPYTLAVGRADAVSAARDMEQVAPGFSETELQGLASASAGPARLAHENAATAVPELAPAQAGAAARRRLLALWAVLLLGVAALAYMVWRLLKQVGAVEPPAN
ncbi:DUF3999 family protein [Rugamonas sp.]|uniref:DUF3999 family protein n=1 Tax=Rugamonas sp. TaxID=1926287 RepID=UPI0025F116CE|nr:DUF3999 family protein [Rugamonas sp.]